MMRAVLLSPLVLVCAGCVQTAPQALAGAVPVRVTNAGQPFQMWDGAAARKAADAACGGRVNVSIYDRFDAGSGEWVYPEGCA